MKQKTITKISAVFHPENFELLIGFLYLNGITNFEEKINRIEFYIDKEQAEIIIEKLVTHFPKGNIELEIEETEIKNWNAEWEKTIEPVFIKDKFIIFPSWKKKEVKKIPEIIKIQIDPKMSFGTGHNETTQLMLELMADFIEGTEKKLLDFGCGTSVLAIAGIRLGIKRAVAIDIDDDSIENSFEYLKINRVFSKVKLYKADIKDIEEKSFDVICANIISSVLVEKMSLILEKLNTGGKLFLSGILLSERNKFIKSMNNKLKILKVSSKGEWIGIYAKKIK